MNKGNVHVPVAVLVVGVAQAVGGLFEPFDLVGLDPVVARVFPLVGRVRMSVKEVDGNGRMISGAAAENLNIVVAGAVNFSRASLGKRVRERLHEGHLRLTTHALGVIMVAKDGSIGQLALLELQGNLENGLEWG